MTKTIELEVIGNVVMTKRRTSRYMRLRVAHDGTPHVSLPFWAAYRDAVRFVELKKNWIIDQQSNRSSCAYSSGRRIGKTHTLQFVSVSKGTRTKIRGNEAIVFHEGREMDIEAQKAAERVVIKALKIQAEQLLPQRLDHLANKYGCEYSSVKISRMRSRWGSCNNQKLIALNCYLMQLPWELIDYVLLHELAHTKEMSHSSAFWNLLSLYVPDLETRKKLLKNYRPTILAQTL